MVIILLEPICIVSNAQKIEHASRSNPAESFLPSVSFGFDPYVWGSGGHQKGGRCNWKNTDCFFDRL